MDTRVLVFGAALVVAACGGHDRPAQPSAAAANDAWVAPEKWKSETIPFPLDFAPDLPRRGVEELRFAPGFMKPESPEFWSYVFVWRLEDDGPLDAATLAAQLGAYFRGLVTAVNAETHKVAAVDATRFVARLTDESGAVVGAVDSYDPFATGEAITLQATIRVRECAGGRRAAVFVVSRAARGAEVWTELEAVGAAFRCQ
jgi:hypothetical protein